jgi:hypothetical protein
MRPGERALQIARTAIGAEASSTDRAFRVRRLDRPGSDYYLVLLDRALAAVDIAQELVMSWAKTSTPRLAVDESTARSLAALGPEASAQLVWRSSSASRSPLYPFWEVTQHDHVLYVDQQQRVWHELESNRRGG